MKEKTPHIGDRVVQQGTGHAGSMIDLDNSTAYVLFDYQRPSSDPKPVPISTLTVVSTMRS